MSNPELSELYIARILVTLYEHWANPVVLHASSITEVSFDTELMFDGQSAPEEWSLFENTVHWLEAEGFIRTEGVAAGYPYDFQRTTLTLKAMEAMKKVPDPLSPDSTLLDGLKGAIGEGKKTAIQTLVNTSMTAIYQAVTNAV
ncbi:hypothetical protein [Marinobacterium weihaiense]|uniref:Uncharacterized protein n=1 Tax=Marinobacterium weihaiense TaxID=2851016 RepID=A0ABS6MEQ2_9GAMM|nr:hypothetical protein [Marinobacterium weihaiense]MBV0934769.1 hypothetical protein [Marinobacterium weihaiense]